MEGMGGSSTVTPPTPEDPVEALRATIARRRAARRAEAGEIVQTIRRAEALAERAAEMENAPTWWRERRARDAAFYRRQAARVMEAAGIEDGDPDREEAT